MDVLKATSWLWIMGMALVTHGALFWAVTNSRRSPRYDPAMNLPVAFVALAALFVLVLVSGGDRTRALAIAGPLLCLASCQLKARRTWAAWLGAAILTAVAMCLSTAERWGWNTQPLMSALLGLTASIGIWMHSGAHGFAKRLRWRAVDAWVRSSDNRQRMYLLRFLLGAFNCAMAVTALNVALHYGICDEPRIVRWLTWLAAVVIVGFYAALRSGFNRRLVDPSMSEPQMLAAISFLAVGYWLVGTRCGGAAMVMLVVILMFGMFSATTIQVGRCSAYGFVTFGVAMLLVSLQDTDPRTRYQQAIHLGMLAVILPTMVILAAMLADLRSRLRERKHALAAALIRIEALATRDELTGLRNRRDMLAQLALQQQRAKRSNAGFCLCLIDIDHFKQVNDMHGHGVGDEVLKAFADTASGSLRDTDLIGRWGGEEFIVMLPGFDSEVAATAIERMRQALASTAMSTSRPGLAVTFSAGLVCCAPNESLEQAIERADRALYQAKSAGRNRTVTMASR